MLPFIFKGWSIGEHGEFAKYSNFDIATRVPLIIQVPSLVRNMEVVNELVELVDLFPTLVDLTQVSSSLPECPMGRPKMERCTEGRSLVQVMVSTLQKLVGICLHL